MVSKLDQDASIALANIREWRNSLVPVNRFPQEVLSLIPTHLPRESDLVHASSVCCHWRRNFTQHAVLWSKLDLSIKRSCQFVKRRLERAKGSPLDITSARLSSPDILALVSSRSQQLRKLDFLNDYWSQIQLFSEAISGPLPLLRSLQIHVVDLDPLDPDSAIRPSLPLFRGALNLKEFCLRTEGVPYLNQFTFPNLTTFELAAIHEDEEAFPILQLLDFLDASPTLRTVHVTIDAEISLEGVLPGRTVTLPNVERLAVEEREPGYRIATHIACPSAKHVSLTREDLNGLTVAPDAFPTSETWNAIPPRYMANQIDEVVLESVFSQNLSCSISFMSPSSATLEVGYRMVETEEDDAVEPSLGWGYVRALNKASGAIQGHPLFATVKRLRIQDWRTPITPGQLKRVARVIGRFFRSMGPLEELALDASDLRPYLTPFTDLPDLDDLKQSYVYPQIKGLAISDRGGPLDAGSKDSIMEFAKSQHARGVPFERVVLRLRESAEDMVEKLRPWVGGVDFQQGAILADDEDPMQL